MEKLFRYHRIYSYGDLEDNYLIKANSKQEAIDKLYKSRVESGMYNPRVEEECLNEVNFNNDIADLW